MTQPLVQPLTDAEKTFIQTHLLTDVRQLLLQVKGANSLAVKRLIEQVQARQKARAKLPTWYAHPDVLFPPVLSVEQASSERTARYKAGLVAGCATLADLTGGMGVDTWAFADVVEAVRYVEQQPLLTALAAHNLPRLGRSNVTVYTQNGADFLAAAPRSFDWLYLDPARRDEQGGKVVRLEDCEPDVSTAGRLAPWLAKTDRLLLKVSPLVDLEATLRQLETVFALHVVAVQGEVKEVLCCLGHAPVAPGEVHVTAINLTDSGDSAFTFVRAEERQADSPFGEPRRYLYEPNAAVLKAGAFRLVASRFGLSKLAPHSHLYTADTLVPAFPGRTFEVLGVTKADRKALRALVPEGKANLTVRNFPQPVEALRDRLGLREGGSVYIFATTLLTGDKRLIITRKT